MGVLGGAVHHATSAAVTTHPLGLDCPMETAEALGSTNRVEGMIVSGSLVLEFGIHRIE